MHDGPHGAQIVAFRIIFALATALCLAAGLLVTASLFIADRAPQSWRFLLVSLVVSAVCFALAFVVAGIRAQVLQIARLTTLIPEENRADIRRRVGRLLTYLLVGGLALTLMLALLTYGILARIDQGFAVFG
jgi:predicted DNA repair protein MutK